MIGLRKRNVAEYSDISLEDDNENQQPKSRIARVLHSADMFPKAPSYIAQRTLLGAILSFITIAFLAFLVISEFVMFLTVKRVDTLSVDMAKDGQILIYFNISFPNIRCTELSVDTVDASGEQHINIYHRMHKNPIGDDGLIAQVEEEPAALGHGIIDITKIPGSPFYCGPCYVDSPVDGRQCCNSCNDVLNQFQRLGKRPPAKTKIEQCVYEMSLSYPGCNMYGAMEVNKVAGNFHFAPGRSFSQEHETRVHHIHEFNPVLIGRFNASHIIHELSFGEKIPHVKYPLDMSQHIVPTGTSLFKYFIKIVPTAYKRGGGPFSFVTESYQYSFTKHRVDFNPAETIMLPGVFFVYDLSPIKIHYHDTGEPFLHFIVSMCAVIGGVFVVSSYIDRLLHFMLKGIRKVD
jgi:hypothetical protein